MQNYTSIVDIGNGKIAYTPSGNNRLTGKRHVDRINKKWQPHSSFFHFQNGGHVAALRCHVGNKYFLKYDISDFFPSVHRNRIIKRLKKIGYSFFEAESFAALSTVKSQKTGKFAVPFGFVQSSTLAALDLHFSDLGQFIFEVAQSVRVSVSVDDIIFSSDNCSRLLQLNTDCLQAFQNSNYMLNIEKSVTIPTNQITAFNIQLNENGLKVKSRKMDYFKNEIMRRRDARYSQAIYGYVNSVNPAQTMGLARQLGSFC